MAGSRGREGREGMCRRECRSINKGDGRDGGDIREGR
jgi:hypothetical protein